LCKRCPWLQRGPAHQPFDKLRTVLWHTEVRDQAAGELTQCIQCPSVVSCPALPGCYTQGDTIDEALENIKEAILLCLEDIRAQNQPIPDMSGVLISSVAVAV
jgi:predicted RNase H-like HicB family nuclease